MTSELHKPYVLMIEDDPDDVFFAQHWMRELSIEIPTHFIQESDRVFEWLDAQSNLPSLIVLDRHLPATDGNEILKELKSHPVYAGIPVIILSGTALPEDIRACYAAGAASFILKPKGGTEKVAMGIRNFIAYWFELCQLPSSNRITETSLHAK